jgi:hypothetical protein
MAVIAVIAASLVQCSQDGPSDPRVLGVRLEQPLAVKAPQGPSVASTNPSFGDQGTTVDVHVLGSGFTNGATVAWLLNGVANDHVHTNHTQFVSSSEVVANVTIAPDATLAFWDVQIFLVGGKNGVGSDAFEVTSAQVLSPSGVNSVYGTNDLGEIVGYGNDAFVVDDASRFVDLGGGQAWALEPGGSTALGRDASFFAVAWTRQSSGSWAATSLPRAPNSGESIANSAAYAPDGSLLVAGWDGIATSKHAQATNRPVVWQRVGSTWLSPIIYALPAGATAAGARTINGKGQIAGNVDASGIGAVWDSPTSPVRLDGLPNAINSAGTLIVGQRGTVPVPVYWWRDPVSLAWHTAGVVLPSISSPSCSTGSARGLNDAGIVVGDSCGPDGKRQATVWVLDLSSGIPTLVGSPQALPGLGARGGPNPVVSSAGGVTRTAPYAASGSAAQSGGQNFAVRWVLR